VGFKKKIDRAQSADWRAMGTADLPRHARQYLKRRGISEEVWRLNSVRFLKPHETAALWGAACQVEAILFPFSTNYGTARLLGVKERKFRSTTGPARIYEPKYPAELKLDTKTLRADAGRPLLICEGPTRALAAISHGIPAIAISGCWNWQRSRKPLPQLLKYRWRKRRVFPVFDADVTENPNVLWPFLLFGDWLEAQRCDVRFMRVPKVSGSKTGLDDFLAKEGREGFDNLNHSAWSDSPKLEALRLGSMRTTEGGLAKLLTLRYGDDIRYDSETETWYSWNGTLWVPQPKKAPEIQEHTKEAVTWILAEAARTSNKDRRKQLLRWGAGCDKRSVVRGAMDLACSDPALRVRVTDLDQDPYLLGTQSGILNLKTGALTHASRDQLVTRSVGAPFVPDATCPRWVQFINEIAADNDGVAAFLQQLAGYLLLGGNPERYIFFLHGEGRNGKSVLIETLLKLLGDYGVPAKSDLIMQHKLDRDSESPQPFLLTLRGARYITASEVKQGMKLDAALVKSLTGGDEITVRGLHSAPARFTIEGKIVIRCNHRPIINGADQAIWDRVIEIPFDLRLTEQEQDRHLRETLNTEMPGILSWAVEGCRQYLDAGFNVPAAVKKQTASYRDAMDSVATWLKERTKKDVAARTSISDLYEDYEMWCSKQSREGLDVVIETKRAVGATLERHGFKRRESHSKTRWAGVRLK
jgi:P4 family phage/plasmid primase-like protien